MAKFAKLVWLAAVQLFYFCLSFFFHIIQTKKRRRERSKSNLWKGMTKTNVHVCCNAVPETQPPLSSINQAQGIFLQVDAAVLHLHNHSSCMPVASSSKPSRITLPRLLRPQYAIKLGYCQSCFLQSDEKKIQMSGLWTTKSTTRTQRRFSRYSKFHAKERSSDRRLLSIFFVKLRVIEKASLCLCGVFALGTCSHQALFLERWTHIFI